MAGDGADQPQLIKQWWTQAIDQPTDIGQCYFDVAFQINQQTFGLLWIFVHHLACHACTEDLCRQQWA